MKIQKEITKAVNEHFAEKAAISMLTECESKRKYHRKRMFQLFHSAQEQPATIKSKSHSPNFSNVTWDKEKLRETLENWPADVTMNWSQVGRDHGIPGNNARQVVKEFTAKQGIDTSHITTPKRKTTLRPRKQKLPSYEVSIRSNSSIRAVEGEINSIISSPSERNVHPTPLQNTPCVEEVWSVLKLILNEAMPLFIPKVVIRKKQLPVWFTPSLRHMRKCLKRKFKRNPSGANQAGVAPTGPSVSSNKDFEGL